MAKQPRTSGASRRALVTTAHQLATQEEQGGHRPLKSRNAANKKKKKAEKVVTA